MERVPPFNKIEREFMIFSGLYLGKTNHVSRRKSAQRVLYVGNTACNILREPHKISEEIYLSMANSACSYTISKVGNRRAINVESVGFNEINFIHIPFRAGEFAPTEIMYCVDSYKSLLEEVYNTVDMGFVDGEFRVRDEEIDYFLQILPYLENPCNLIICPNFRMIMDRYTKSAVKALMKVVKGQILYG